MYEVSKNYLVDLLKKILAHCQDEVLRSAHEAVVLVLKRAHHRSHVLQALRFFLLVSGGRSLGSLFIALASLGSGGSFRFVDCELDGGRGGFGSQVIHAGLQAQLPAVKVHRRQLAIVGLRHVNVQRLQVTKKTVLFKGIKKSIFIIKEPMAKSVPETDR